MRPDYGSLGLGTREGNLRVTEEITAWLNQIGERVLAQGYASSIEVKVKHPPLSSRSVGTLRFTWFHLQIRISGRLWS